MSSSQSYAQLAQPPQQQANSFQGGMAEGGSFPYFHNGNGMPVNYHFANMPVQNGQSSQQPMTEHGQTSFVDGHPMHAIPGPGGMPMGQYPVSQMGFLMPHPHHLPPHMQMAGSPEFAHSEFGDGLGYDADGSMSLNGDDSAEMRLIIAQQAQAHAVDANNAMFACPYCDKQYFGKHARSIWRRHLQDKHAIPLSQQPRRTRWDGDANRPKNAEERRQRMLESKRRWARKKRMLDKEARLAGSDGGDMSPYFTGDESESVMSPEDIKERSLPVPAPVPAPVMPAAAAPAALAPSMLQPQAPASPILSMPSVAPLAKKKRDGKPKGTQQIKFHHMTTADIPSYGGHGSGHPMGPTVWTFADGKPTTGPQMGASAARIADRSALATSNLANAGLGAGRQMKREASAPSLQPHIASAMMQSLSPRRAFGSVDTNTANARRMARSQSSMDAFHGAGKPPMQADFAGKPFVQQQQFATPFANSFPVPQDAAPAKTAVKRGKNGTKGPVHARFVSPPRAREQDSRIAGAILSPGSSKKQAHTAANNPFSLEHHRISPPGGNKTYETTHERPSSRHQNGVSPMHRRLKGGEAESNMLAEPTTASPLSKSRRLPPLVKTPVRPPRFTDAPTPDNAMGFATALGTASVGRRQGGMGLATPMSSRMERLLGGSTSIGLTPFDAKLASTFSVARNGFYARPSPLKRGEGDQFSSPQHLNLTQSLGLAPHSTMKGSSSVIGGGIGSVNATPFINSFLNSNSPWTKELWPDSVFRQSTYNATELTQRSGSPSAAGGSSSAQSQQLRSGAGSERHSHAGASADPGRNDDEYEEEDDVPTTLFLNETPSRPAKLRHTAFFDSPTSNSSSAQKKRRRTASPTKTNMAAPSEAAAAKSPLPRFDAPTASFDGELAMSQSTRAANEQAFASSSPEASTD